MTLIAIAVLQVEVIRAMKRDGTFDHEVWWVKGLRRIVVARRHAHRAVDVPARVRPRHPAVPAHLPADAHHVRGRRHARRRAGLHRPVRRDQGRRVLPRHAQPAVARRLRARRVARALPALHRRGAARRGRRAARLRQAQPARLRRVVRRRHRHDRPRGRVGLVARLDADPVAVGDPAAGRRDRPGGRARRQPHRRVHRRAARSRRDPAGRRPALGGPRRRRRDDRDDRVRAAHAVGAPARRRSRCATSTRAPSARRS